MKNFSPFTALGIALSAIATGIALAAAALGLGSGAATASSSADYTTESAGRAVAELQGQGYSVQINGLPNGDLSRCKVTGVDGLTAKPTGTVYVDVDCPTSND